MELNLRSFYEEIYPKLHPTLDVEDVEWKFACMRLIFEKIPRDQVDYIVEVGCGSGKLLMYVTEFFSPSRAVISSQIIKYGKIPDRKSKRYYLNSRKRRRNN